MRPFLFVFALIASMLFGSVSFAGCPNGLCPAKTPVRSTVRSTVTYTKNFVKKVRPRRPLFRGLFR